MDQFIDTCTRDLSGYCVSVTVVFNQLCLLKWLRGDSSVWLFSDMLIKGFLRKELLFAAKNSGCILDNLSDVYTVRPYLFLLFFFTVY